MQKEVAQLEEEKQKHIRRMDAAITAFSGEDEADEYIEVAEKASMTPWSSKKGLGVGSGVARTSKRKVSDDDDDDDDLSSVSSCSLPKISKEMNNKDYFNYTYGEEVKEIVELVVADQINLRESEVCLAMKRFALDLIAFGFFRFVVSMLDTYAKNNKLPF